MKTYLEDAEFTARTAANPKEAWQILERSLPDLVITDVMMPQWSGYCETIPIVPTYSQFF